MGLPSVVVFRVTTGHHVSVSHEHDGRGSFFGAVTWDLCESYRKPSGIFISSEAVLDNVISDNTTYVVQGDIYNILIKLLCRRGTWKIYVRIHSRIESHFPSYMVNHIRIVASLHLVTRDGPVTKPRSSAFPTLTTSHVSHSLFEGWMYVYYCKNR